jgi:hypothetical protein
MRISRLEVFVQSVVIVCSVWIVMHNLAYSNENFASDFRPAIYNTNSWYKPWAVWPYQKLFRVLPELEATFVWFGVLVLCYVVITHQLCKVRYGWLVSLACMQAFWSHSGNINPLLAIYLLSPVTVCLAIVVKPHFVVAGLVVAFAARFRAMAEQSAREDGAARGAREGKI